LGMKNWYRFRPASKKGGGRLSRASCFIDLLPSLRPVGTSQWGPFVCCTEKKKDKQKKLGLVSVIVRSKAGYWPVATNYMKMITLNSVKDFAPIVSHRHLRKIG
jgi:hypothetical protein